MKKIHYISGIIISIFIGLHLFNHCYSLLGAEKHIALMQRLRPIYRNVVAETILLLAVLVQIISGLRLFKARRTLAHTPFEKLHIWTGLYLAIFFVIHLAAVLSGRLWLHLDTNFYFGAAGINSFPFNVFFIPYYGFAVIAFFGHLAAVHHQKMKHRFLGITPKGQSKMMLLFGICLSILLIYGLTNHFKGFPIPPAYQVLIGK
ncbi:hypothetical protein DBR32_14030 [Taibaiella sp. KBW10]|uniref:hypothetical protein n=1 Tax=Taibaiella sp. KBW10 TaxID=2153357 RepID=UPI000F5A9B05|nr:hypothetical protein [Taibaiella sp. KBW10]RQO30020.1 hypothetical protein DBR32_14030 [Taibaiella sp. KBW10]